MTQQHLQEGANLLCLVGTRLCAMPLWSVVEIMRPLPIRALAGMPDFVMGLSIVRGSPIAVIDARCLLLGVAEPKPPGRFVTAKVGERRVAIAVDAVVGVRALAPGSLQDLPPLLGDASADVVAAIGVLDHDLLIVLQSARMLPDSAWSAIASEGAVA